MSVPSGTVTFLFTDIEGSTARWERAPADTREGIATHDSILRRMFEAHQGHIFKTIGDAFCVAFSRAGDAAETALQAQIALEQADPDNHLPVRMALYSGETDERDGDYFGRPVNRAARLLDVGHGGQILVGQTTAELIRDDLREEVVLRDLGSHRLKDLQHPERIYQLQHPALRSDFPPLRSLEIRPHNLPRQLSSFIGRANEIDQVKELLAGACLLTITGEGGSGKTRLAMQVAAELLEAYPDGVWLIELAPISNPALIAQSIAAALGIREQPGIDLVDLILGSLMTKRLLLILDNCEHLNDNGACAHIVSRLLKSSFGLRVLATSREALELVGETQWRIPTLSLPASRHNVTARSLGKSEAVRLFVERAAAVRSSFALTNANAPSVSRICQAVDGIPLAIELAAARISAMSPAQIIEKMESSGKFPLLTGGLKTAPTRQHTLKAAFDWSYDRLTDSEKTLLYRLTVFSGGWSLSAAERVCSGDGLEEIQVLDLMSSLASKSMIVVDPERVGETRYRLLETIREYSTSAGPDERSRDIFRDKHRDFFFEMTEEAAPHIQQPDQQMWLDQLETEHDNIRNALAWTSNSDMRLRFAALLHRFWLVRGYHSEGRRWVEDALIRAIDAPVSLKAKALNALGILVWAAGDYQNAREVFSESLAHFRACDDVSQIPRQLTNLGIIEYELGNFSSAMDYYDESLQRFRERGEEAFTASVLCNMGAVHRDKGDYNSARPVLQESLQLFKKLEDKAGTAFVLHLQGRIDHKVEDWRSAARQFRQSLVLFQELRDKRGAALVIDAIGCSSAACGLYERAVQLLAAAEVLCHSVAAPLPPYEQKEHKIGLEKVRGTLDAPEFSRLTSVGREMSFEEAAEYALATHFDPD